MDWKAILLSWGVIFLYKLIFEKFLYKQVKLRLFSEPYSMIEQLQVLQYETLYNIAVKNSYKYSKE